MVAGRGEGVPWAGGTVRVTGAGASRNAGWGLERVAGGEHVVLDPPLVPDATAPSSLDTTVRTTWLGGADTITEAPRTASAAS